MTRFFLTDFFFSLLESRVINCLPNHFYNLFKYANCVNFKESAVERVHLQRYLNALKDVGLF